MAASPNSEGIQTLALAGRAKRSGSRRGFADASKPGQINGTASELSSSQRCAMLERSFPQRECLNQMRRRVIRAAAFESLQPTQKLEFELREQYARRPARQHWLRGDQEHFEQAAPHGVAHPEILNPLQNQVEPFYLLSPNNSSLPHSARRPTAEPAPNPRKTAADAEIPGAGAETSLVHDFARSGKTPEMTMPSKNRGVTARHKLST